MDVVRQHDLKHSASFDSYSVIYRKRRAGASASEHAPTLLHRSVKPIMSAVALVGRVINAERWWIAWQHISDHILLPRNHRSTGETSIMKSSMNKA